MATSPDDAFEAKALAIAEDALDHPLAERADFIIAASAGDRALRDRAMDLARYAAEDEDALLMTGGGAAVIADEDRPETIGAYRIEREIGRGGMGVVYLGERMNADFEHRAAIKLVGGRSGDAAALERLRSERRLLARLKHPHIAHFYDGGETERGDPYLAMEYVEGRTLTDVLRESSASLTERLRLFQQVCAAVAYAHSNLVIHRDLSTSNILVTHEGEAKVIDFGVSYAIGEADDDAKSSKAATRGFLAPERARGEPATTLSDVYSLGVLLERMIDRADAPRKGDLAAIARKAQSDAPTERYQGASELSAEIDRYRAGGSIDALSDDWRHRALRFGQRRKFAVAAAAAAFLGVLAAAVTVSILYVKVDAAEARAVKRFEDVRTLAKTLMFELHDDIAGVPGSIKARERLAATAQSYLDALAVGDDAPFDVRLETAIGFRRLAEIVGVPSGINLGRRDDAGDLLARSLDGLDALRAERPRDPDVLRAYARTAYEYVIYEWIASDDSLATIAKAEIGRAAYDALSAVEPLSIEDEIVYLDMMSLQASAYVWEDRSAEGLPILRAAIARCDGVQREYPGSDDIAAACARLSVDYGDGLARESDFAGGEYEEAVSAIDAGLAIQRRLAAAAPDDLDRERTVAVSLWKRSSVLYGIDRNLEAIKDLEESEAVFRKFYALDPDDYGSLRSISILTLQRARSLSGLERHDEAVAVSAESLAIRRQLADGQPDDQAFADEVAETQVTFAEILLAAGEDQRACSELAEGLSRWNASREAGTLSTYEEDLIPDEGDPLLAACPNALR